MFENQYRKKKQSNLLLNAIPPLCLDMRDQNCDLAIIHKITWTKKKKLICLIDLQANVQLNLNQQLPNTFIYLPMDGCVQHN